MEEAGRHRPYVPEGRESGEDDDDEAERIPKGLPVRGISVTFAADSYHQMSTCVLRAFKRTQEI